jgi:hypothetical protein
VWPTCTFGTSGKPKKKNMLELKNSDSSTYRIHCYDRAAKNGVKGFNFFNVLHGSRGKAFSKPFA